MIIHTTLQLSMNRTTVSPLEVASTPKSMVASLGTCPFILSVQSILTDMYGVDTGEYFDSLHVMDELFTKIDVPLGYFRCVSSILEPYDFFAPSLHSI